MLTCQGFYQGLATGRVILPKDVLRHFTIVDILLNSCTFAVLVAWPPLPNGPEAWLAFGHFLFVWRERRVTCLRLYTLESIYRLACCHTASLDLFFSNTSTGLCAVYVTFWGGEPEKRSPHARTPFQTTQIVRVMFAVYSVFCRDHQEFSQSAHF